MDFIPKIFGQLLGLIYNVVPDYGIAIILFTIVTQVVMLPLAIKQHRSQKIMAELTPKTKELQEKYKNDRETLNRKTLELYKEKNYNPLSGCLPMIFNLFVVIGLFSVLREPGKYVFHDPVVLQKATNSFFLWIPNLSQPDLLSNIIKGADWAKSLPGLMPILSAGLTYLSITLTPNPAAEQKPVVNPNKHPSDQQKPMGGNMMSIMKIVAPGMILLYGRMFTGGLVLYWTVRTILSIIQQMMFNKMKEGENIIHG